MIHILCAAGCLAALMALPMQAFSRASATQRHVWTNDDLAALGKRGLISIIGPLEASETQTGDPSQDAKKLRVEWFARQAEKLRTNLELQERMLRQYSRSIADVQSLKASASGINLGEGDVGITPQSGMQTLQRRVDAARAALDDLEDAARRQDIEPGVLRGQ